MVRFRMGETLLRIVGLYKIKLIFVKTDFLYYSAIAPEKKERRVLFFERNCVERIIQPFPRNHWVSVWR